MGRMITTCQVWDDDDGFDDDADDDDEEEEDDYYLTSMRSIRAVFARPPSAAKQIMIIAWWRLSWSWIIKSC